MTPLRWRSSSWCNPQKRYIQTVQLRLHRFSTQCVDPICSNCCSSRSVVRLVVMWYAKIWVQWGRDPRPRRSGRQGRQPDTSAGNGLRAVPRSTPPIPTAPRRIRTSRAAEKLEKTSKNFLTNQPSHSILMKLFETAPNKRVAAIAQSVERILGKDEVASSNLASSSICCYSSVGRAHPW